jgi:O-antigen ligase
MIFFGCSIIVLYFSYTKAGWGIFLLWVVLWYILIKEIIKSIIIISLTFLLLFSTPFTTTLRTLFHKEVKYLEGEKIPTSTLLQGRIGRWSKGFYLFKKLPLFNKLLLGMGDFFWCTQGAHNDFLRVLWANGIIGITVWLLLWLNIIKKLKQNIKTNKEIAIFGLLLTLMITIDSLGITPSMYPNYQWFVLSCIGLSVHNLSTKNQNT